MLWYADAPYRGSCGGCMIVAMDVERQGVGVGFGKEVTIDVEA